MRFLFLIAFMLFPVLAFSATPHYYSCSGNQPNSIVNIQFDASSSSENYVTLTTSHDYKSLQYLYSTPIRFSMKSLTDALGDAKFQVVGFYSSVSIANITCSPDGSVNYWQLISFFIGAVSAMAFVMAATHRWW